MGNTSSESTTDSKPSDIIKSLCYGTEKNKISCDTIKATYSINLIVSLFTIIFLILVYYNKNENYFPILILILSLVSFVLAITELIKFGLFEKESTTLSGTVASGTAASGTVASETVASGTTS